jgi:hypothetical protein
MLMEMRRARGHAFAFNKRESQSAVGLRTGLGHCSQLIVIMRTQGRRDPVTSPFSFSRWACRSVARGVPTYR